MIITLQGLPFAGFLYGCELVFPQKAAIFTHSTHLPKSTRISIENSRYALRFKFLMRDKDRAIIILEAILDCKVIDVSDFAHPELRNPKALKLKCYERFMQP